MHSVLKQLYRSASNRAGPLLPRTHLGTSFLACREQARHPYHSFKEQRLLPAMEQSAVNRIATMLLSGNWLAILITTLIAFGLPALLHVLLYRSSPAALSNDFLLLGPSGSGKTAFCSLVRSASANSSYSSSTMLLTLYLFKLLGRRKIDCLPQARSRNPYITILHIFFSYASPGNQNQV